MVTGYAISVQKAHTSFGSVLPATENGEINMGRKIIFAVNLDGEIIGSIRKPSSPTKQCRKDIRTFKFNMIEQGAIDWYYLPVRCQETTAGWCTERSASWSSPSIDKLQCLC